jgi:hypothetical protein
MTKKQKKLDEIIVDGTPEMKPFAPYSSRLPLHSSDHFKRWHSAAIHEAGHAIADLYCTATGMGEPHIERAEIGYSNKKPWGRIVNLVLHPKALKKMSSNKLREYIFHSGVGCSAGSVAERVPYSKADLRRGIAIARRGEATADDAAHFAADYLAGVPDASNAEICEAWSFCEAAAGDLFQHPSVKKAVERVAQALLKRGSLDIDAIVRAAKMGKRGGYWVKGHAAGALEDNRDFWLASSRFAPIPTTSARRRKPTRKKALQLKRTGTK